MPKAYVIFTEAIHDEEGLAAYAVAAGATMAGHPAKLLAMDDAADVLEGSWFGDRTVMLEFESVEAAKAWYDSEEYTKVKPLRQAAAECNAVILTGFEMPPRPA